MATPVIASKTLTVDTWADYECPSCGNTFDIERHSARMAPDSALFVAPNEKSYAVMDEDGKFICPHCGAAKEDSRARLTGKSTELGKTKNKKVELTLLMHPQWLQGSSKQDELGREYGGSATDSIEATVRWNNARAEKLRLLEVRGLVAIEKISKSGERKTAMVVPPEVTCPETMVTFFTDERGGTMPKQSTFACGADGSPNDVLSAIKATNKTGPNASYVIQGYSPTRAEANQPYSGRFFATASNTRPYNEAIKEWEQRKDSDLSGYWPTSELPFGFMTHMNNGGIPNHGYTHWWKMFNPRQLLVHAQLLKAIDKASANEAAKLFVFGLFQNFLRNENMFCFWHMSHDHFVPHLSNTNYHPKNSLIEVGAFCPVGYGPWPSACGSLDDAGGWMRNPWEIVAAETIPQFANSFDAKGVRVVTNDRISPDSEVRCASATDLDRYGTNTFDLVVTDPPFGGLLHYSELSDFFYVWLRLVLKSRFPEYFEPEFSPKTLEAVANRARHPQDADAFYQRVLTNCWREAYRVLKPGGILAFTFHHSEDEPWVGVLESLFDAGFYLESTYPIRSDETKGEGAKPGTFGSQTIEYDIIHVCRKRIVEPQPISWARLRRLIVEDVRHLKLLLEQHRSAGLPAADLDIIKRGKALEYFSRHYGKVFIEQGRQFTIREALPAIKLLVDEEADATSGIQAPPANAEPYTRQFFRIFYETSQVPRDQMQKFLRGTGIAPSDFVERGWCSEKGKVFTLSPPVELARAWKGASRKGMARDFDQTMFLVGGCFEGSNIRITDTLDSPNFAPHPATAELVDWLISHGGSPQIKIAAQRAQTIYRDWLGKNIAKVQEQLSLFDLES
jgi:predicted RNA-binding Zn-ribbon protein involved in translation (DUF1610 family)